MAVRNPDSAWHMTYYHTKPKSPVFILERIVGFRFTRPKAMFWTGTNWECNLSRAKRFASEEEIIAEVENKEIDDIASNCYPVDITAYKNEVCG